MTTVPDAALVLSHVSRRTRGPTRWVAVADVVKDSGLPPERVESAVDFLSGRGLIIANGTPAHSVRITPEGAKMAQAG